MISNVAYSIHKSTTTADRIAEYRGLIASCVVGVTSLFPILSEDVETCNYLVSIFLSQLGQRQENGSVGKVEYILLISFYTG